MPILVAGQHYRTTEASNGSFAEQPVIGRLFIEEELLQCCMTTCFSKINMSFEVSQIFVSIRKFSYFFF